VLDSLRGLVPPGDSRDRAAYLCRQGQYRAVLGDSAALPLVRQGRSMAERLGERRLAGNCLEVDALAHSLLGRTDSVFALMDLAESLLRATHDHASLGRLYSRRSDELLSRGRLGEAKQALSQVLAEAAISKNRERYAFAYGGLGSVALRVGDLPTAIAYFGHASALYDSLGQAVGAKIARQNRAWVLSISGDAEAARPALRRCSPDRNSHGSHFVEARWGKPPASSRRRKTRRVHAGSRRRRAQPSATTTADCLSPKDISTRLRYFTEYLGSISTDDRLQRNLIRVRLAEVWARRGDLERAEREITAASREMETWQASLGDDQLRRYAFAATALGERDPQGPVAQVLAALVKGGRVDAAFALAEQRRARALTDRLNQADALREGGVPAGSPAHRARSSTAPEIAAALPDERTALLEYVAGSEGAPTTLFIVTRAGVRARLLPPADTLAASIGRLVALLEAGGSAEGPARSLGSALLAPAASALSKTVTRLVIVPDGPLHRVPFDALLLDDTVRTVQRWAIGLAPSAAVVATLWRDRPTPAAEASQGKVQLLALGDPAFKDERGLVAAPESETYRSAFNAEGGLPPPCGERNRGPRGSPVCPGWRRGAASGPGQRAMVQARAAGPLSRDPSRYPRAGRRELAGARRWRLRRARAKMAFSPPPICRTSTSRRISWCCPPAVLQVGWR
jgi:tetratricopeptide (TPR) repeat protein